MTKTSGTDRAAGKHEENKATVKQNYKLSPKQRHREYVTHTALKKIVHSKAENGLTLSPSMMKMSFASSSNRFGEM